MPAPKHKPPKATPPVKPTATARAVQALEAAPPREPKATAKKAAREEKPAKLKLVRDSFTIPKPEYAVIDELKQRAARLGRPMKKSELLRAGLKALAAMPDNEFLAGVTAVPTVKTGRPAKA